MYKVNVKEEHLSSSEEDEESRSKKRRLKTTPKKVFKKQKIKEEIIPTPSTSKQIPCTSTNEISLQEEDLLELNRTSVQCGVDEEYEPPKKKKQKSDTLYKIESQNEEVEEKKESDEEVSDKGEVGLEKKYLLNLGVKDFNLFETVVDEISLEGLDGITLEALWTRLEEATDYTIIFSSEIKEEIWNYIKMLSELTFYELPEARSKLKIFNRYKYFDEERGVIYDAVSHG